MEKKTIINKKLNADFAIYISELIAESHLDLRQLAKLTNRSLSWIQRVKNPNLVPDAIDDDALRNLSKALGFNKSHLDNVRAMLHAKNSGNTQLAKIIGAFAESNEQGKNSLVKFAEKLEKEIRRRETD